MDVNNNLNLYKVFSLINVPWCAKYAKQMHSVWFSMWYGFRTTPLLISPRVTCDEDGSRRRGKCISHAKLNQMHIIQSPHTINYKTKDTSFHKMIHLYFKTWQDIVLSNKSTWYGMKSKYVRSGVIKYMILDGLKPKYVRSGVIKYMIWFEAQVCQKRCYQINLHDMVWSLSMSKAVSSNKSTWYGVKPKYVKSGVIK